MTPPRDEERARSSSAGVAVLSPIGRDAELIIDALTAADIRAFPVRSAADLLRLVAEEVGGVAAPGLDVVVATDHALGVEWANRLVEVLAQQPAWSDIPMVLLAGGDSAAESFYARPIAQRLPVGSSVTVLDRPVRTAALVSAVRAARRARIRQLEVRELIDARDRALTDAKAANRAKSDYLAVMSHELRSPLNAIMGHVQLIEMGVHGPVTPGQQKALARIQQAHRHILRMTDDLLDYARIEAGRLEYRIAPVDLRDAVDQVLGLVRAQLDGKGLSWSSDVLESEVVAHADPDRLRQVLLNLVSNAVKFTPAGGRVEITASARGEDDVHIEVRDTGIGIPAEKLGAIFEPFVQAHEGGTDQGERGTGLGLAISREIALAMDGELTVRSVVGEGSTFTVVLPRARAAQVSGEAAG